MRNRFVLALVLAVSAASHAAWASQPTARSAPALVVDGDVAKPLSLTSASSDVIVADVVDGKPLSERQGPLRLVAPKDLMGSRSVRMLRRIQIVRLPK